MGLTDIILNLTGKVLSEEKAKIAEENFGIQHREYFDFFQEDLFNRDGNLIHRMVEYDYASSPDASHGWKSPHNAWSPIRIETLKYNKERQLIEKEEQTFGETFLGRPTTEIITFKYRPGDFFHSEKLVSNLSR